MEITFLFFYRILFLGETTSCFYTFTNRISWDHFSEYKSVFWEKISECIRKLFMKFVSDVGVYVLGHKN